MNNEKPQNPYVFPMQNDMVVAFGMTLRDYFAAKAMQAMISRDNPSAGFSENTAEQIYFIADAMLKQREK